MQDTINILGHFGFFSKQDFDTLVFFKIRFYIKCRLKVNLAYLYICIYIQGNSKKNLP